MMKAYRIIIILGLISLLGDVVYEGSRGILPVYLEFLGASALLVGLIFGVSDVISFGFRPLTGLAIDLTRAYLAFMLIGYGLIVAIPAIGLVNEAWMVMALILIERIGKAIRTPARNTLLSIVGKGVGAGRAFGLHELLDQVGAVIGPLLMAILLRYTGSFNSSFIVLFAPYIALMTILLSTYRSLKATTISPTRSSLDPKRFGLKHLPKGVWLYLIAVLINTACLMHISLMLYRAHSYFEAWLIPILYLIVQAVDAIAAPTFGWLYDRVGSSVLLMPFAVTMIPSILALVGGGWELIVALVLFGLILGVQESVYRAVIAELVPLERRGLIYGLLDLSYGFGFMVSGVVFGLIVTSMNLLAGITFSVATGLLSLIVLSLSLKLKGNSAQSKTQ
ncbi:MAG: MFS transporter [Candidatus Nezhaarchaeota archaeon]|nr:MFS transporter [Candidatus Nezhaarchaeota archaeon]MCX8141162.1 MFS transporter [Candidatus Nezhaarchaeota archaeon]MDW8050835.1 MFS transporter [Nitrososphaerota archaeon]